MPSENMGNPSSQLDAILRAFPDLLITVNDQGVILEYKAGDAVSTLFAPPETFVGQRAEEVLPREFAESLMGGLRDLKGGGEPVAFQYAVKQGGSRHWFEARLVRLSPGRVVVVVREATRHIQAEEQVRSQLKRMAALRTIDLAISSSLDLPLTLSVVLSQVVSQLSVDAADILLLNAEKVLEFTAGVGFRTEALQHTHLQLGESFAGTVALNQKMLRVPEIASQAKGFMKSLKFAEEGFRCYFGVPLIAKGRVRGVLEIFHRTPLEPDADWQSFLEALADQASIAIENGMLLKELQRTNLELTLAHNATIEGWSRALDLRDRDSEGHTRRVTQEAVRLGRRLGLAEADLLHIRRGAMLHDIGNMAIPDGILTKPSPLTAEEWVIIKRHPLYAYELLSPISFLGPALDIPHHHHEAWNGSGYPDGLKGNSIPKAARLFAVIDVFDAMTSERPYRPAWATTAAINYISEQRGKHFDPEIATEFLKMPRSGNETGLML